MRPAALAAAALAALAAPVCAMDIDDLRIEYAPIAGKQFSGQGEVQQFSLTDFDSRQFDSVGEDASSHTRTSIDYRRSLTDLRAGFGSLVWGFEVADDLVKQNQSFVSYRGRSFMIDGFLGWAWKLTSAWHVEEGILVGVGRTRWRQDFNEFYNDDTAWNDESEGFSYEYGFDLASYYTVARHWQVGIDLRQMYLTSHTRFIGQHEAGPTGPDANDIMSVSADWKFSVEGINLAAVVGVRF
jgi:hypothetical protein